MDDSMIFVHHGAEIFDPNKIQKNLQIRVNKPFGGLWASPIISDYSWYNWCISNDFRPESLSKKFTFTLKKEAKIFYIDSDKDFRESKYMLLNKDLLWLSRLDFNRIQKEYDAIYLTKKGFLETGRAMFSREGELSFNLYGWDCESITVFNPNAIEPTYKILSK